MLGRMPGATTLDRWNVLSAEAAAMEVLPCCGSRAWARAMAERRPVTTGTDVLAASDAIWWRLGERDWQEAFDSHPRIGEQQAKGEAAGRSLAWSAEEQSGVAEQGERAAERLAAGNQEYEDRFGRTFIVCARGKDLSAILKSLEERMRNDAATELREAAEQQRQITGLRLERWMGAS